MIYTPFIWPLLIAGAILAGLALYTRRFRAVPAVQPFSRQMWLGVWYAWITALAVSTSWPPLREFWFQLSYLPLALFPPAILALAVEYTGQSAWLTRRRLSLLLVVPILAFLIWSTRAGLALFRYDYQTDAPGLASLLLSDSGPWYWVFFAYSITLTVIACGLLLASLRVQRVFLANTLAIVTGILIPVFTETLFTVGITPILGFSLTPTTLVFSGLLFGWALLRNQLFDVVPIARHTVMDTLDDLIIVLDARNHIVDFNDAARAACGLSPRALGTTPDTLPQEWADLFQCYGDIAAHKAEVSIGAGEKWCSYELTVAPITDKRQHTVVGAPLHPA
jgi:PAS domain-containing protein